MKISVFGLGYVGCVSAACLAADGHDVVGVDVSAAKVDMVSQGRSPVKEPGLPELVAGNVAAGRLRATTDASVVADTEISFVCVGTPSRANGDIDLQYVERVCENIGAAIEGSADYHTVVIRSTVLPGSIRDVVVPALERSSNKTAGRDFGVAMNPEFLREGNAIDDYRDPTMVVIGEFDERSGRAVAEAYAAVGVTPVHVDPETAEMVKYASNAFHALKITFANEVGILAKSHGVDGREVMDLVASDTRLNVSRAYMRPGFAFGGSCLPKDLRAVTYRARSRDIDVPLLDSLMASNRSQIERAVRMIEDVGAKRIGILGLSFKTGTDDVRESPAIPIAETLVGRGYEVAIFDEDVTVDDLVGVNRQFLHREIPHIVSLMRPTADEVVASSDVVVVTKPNASFISALAARAADQVVIDLAGVDKGTDITDGGYEGVCW